MKKKFLVGEIGSGHHGPRYRRSVGGHPARHRFVTAASATRNAAEAVELRAPKVAPGSHRVPGAPFLLYFPNLKIRFRTALEYVLADCDDRGDRGTQPNF